MSWRGGGGEGGRGTVESFPSTFLSSSGRRKKRDMRWRKTIGNRQMNESDIMNSHTLMRLIYCRHQQWRGGPVRRRGGGGAVWGGGSQVSQRKAHTHTRIYWHTDTWTHTHTATRMTWRCVCNCSVFNPAMCLLSRRIHITVPSTHTDTHGYTTAVCVCKNLHSQWWCWPHGPVWLQQTGLFKVNRLRSPSI